MTRRVLLIHGAWQGAWVWESVVPMLEAAGLEPLAIDLPGSAPDMPGRAGVTFADQVDFLKDVLADIDGPVFVVAHSGGGLAASQLAEDVPERIAGIVYVAGMMLPDGVGFSELAEACRADDPSASGIWPYLEHGEGVTKVPAAAAVEVFYHDCDPVAAAGAAARLTPQSNAARDVAPRVSAERFGSVPRAYVEARRDRSVVLVVQRRMQQLTPGALRYYLDTGHAPMLADPQALSETLIEAIGALSARRD